MTTEIETTEETIPDHMNGLTSQQQRFACEYVRNGGKLRKAALAAGYAASSAHAIAGRNLRIPKVAQAIATECVLLLGSDVPAAMRVTKKLMLAAKSEDVQLRAARDIQDRAGFFSPRQDALTGGVRVTINLS